MLINKIREMLDLRKKLSDTRRELAELQSYVDKMDDIAEQLVDWGNECASCAAHYKTISMRLKERCDELESQIDAANNDRKVIEA